MSTFLLLHNQCYKIDNIISITYIKFITVYGNTATMQSNARYLKKEILPVPVQVRNVF